MALDRGTEFFKACENGDLEMISYTITTQNFWNVPYVCSVGLTYACNFGRLNVIEFLISKGANNLDDGLAGACICGHLNVIEFLILKGANNWNRGLASACKGGHFEVVKLMISKGANFWNWGLNCACQYGHMEIAELMIFKGAKYDYHHRNFNNHLINKVLTIHLKKQMVCKIIDKLLLPNNLKMMLYIYT